MSKITNIRKAIAAEFTDIEEDLQVLLAASEFEPRSAALDEPRFTVRVFAGPPSVETEDRIDELVELIPTHLRHNKLEGVGQVVVTRCSGHQLFAQGPSDPPVLGVEFTLKAYV